ncbi:MAG: exodeoxyribonuclease-3 [Candidatus Saccharimonadales bacterium]|jgi:exodeoxyribonuclease-3
MKLYSWNVNGIRAVWNKGLFQEFVAEHDPDILCLQETKAQREQSPIEGMDQYKIYWNSAVKRGYSGTAILTKTEPLSVQNDFSDEINAKYTFEDSFGDTSKEGRLLTLEFEDYYITTVYTPNSKNKLERLPMRDKAWDPAYRDHLNELAAKKPVYSCGDMNVAHTEIDLARPKDNVGKHGFTDEERRGLTDLLSDGFVDTFRFFYPHAEEVYSWWTAWGGARDRNVGWRIDYWLASTSAVDNLIDAQVHSDAIGSDHCPVSIEI